MIQRWRLWRLSRAHARIEKLEEKIWPVQWTETSDSKIPELWAEEIIREVQRPTFWEKQK